MSVPNQRTIKVNKSKTDKENLYTTINLNALYKSAKILTEKLSFKLYIYFAMNQNNYTFDLSSNHFCEWANCSRDAYRTAFKELVSKGFLIETSEKNHYMFYDYPKEKDNSSFVF